MPDLSPWLEQFGLETLAGVLADNDVDLDILPDLTEQDFEKLGISLGHRRKLLKAIATLRDDSTIASDKPEQEPIKPSVDRSPCCSATSSAQRRSPPRSIPRT
jgi:hypothetical protein